jgi:uncharacterized membrane protein
MVMDYFSRLLKHLFASSGNTNKHFNQDVLIRIEQAIAQSEMTHSGQIRFIVETSLSPMALYHRQTARERAIEIFSLFQVWDTAENNGVLIYLLMADHDFEIIADRNIDARAGQDYWVKVCKEMEVLLKNQQFEDGVLLGIERIHAILRQHYPAEVITPNELPDQPIII